MADDTLRQPYDVAGEANVEDGHVVVDGPNGIAITLTADAAVLMGERLVAAGQAARETAETEK
ncbi:MAG: hypothetical protein R3E04_00095 [Sphingobium sp.]